MAVFTPVSLDELAPWIDSFSVGQAFGIQGIASGIENSNFFVMTETGEYVLTLFEKLSYEQLPYYLNLMRHLADRGIKVAAPIPNKNGELLSMLCRKPASLVTKLEGDWQVFPTPDHCAKVGAMMARMHIAAGDYAISQPNLRGLSWWKETVLEVLPYLTDENTQMLQSELVYQENFAATELYQKLPRGPVHADLFRNNVMFDKDEELSGFFDFYFAGNDTWLFDVAVSVNDWCINLENGAFDEKRLNAFLGAYHHNRPFLPSEARAWHSILRAAALRFWISRLYDFYLPRDAKMLTAHDPRHFERILSLRTKQVSELPV